MSSLKSRPSDTFPRHTANRRAPAVDRTELSKKEKKDVIHKSKRIMNFKVVSKYTLLVKSHCPLYNFIQFLGHYTKINKSADHFDKWSISMSNKSEYKQIFGGRAEKNNSDFDLNHSRCHG